MPAHWDIERDFNAILAAPQIDWQVLRRAELLLTGGTGFIGRWLLETLVRASDQFGLELRITIPSRDPRSFLNRNPWFFQRGDVELIALDVADRAPQGHFDYVIHAAADASSLLCATNPLSVFKTIVRGTENILTSVATNPETKVLFLSSGAVYGQQPAELSHIPEDWLGAPDPQLPGNTYAESKRMAETLGAIFAKQHAARIVAARIFSLLGPLLPLDRHFAAGNFIRDAVTGQPIIVHGNGTPIRSYLYPTDLAVWLLTLLTRPAKESVYNVGSENPISISELASMVATLAGNGEYSILGHQDTGWNTGRYVPATSRIREEFGLKETVALESAIQQTAIAYRLSLSN